MSIQKYGTAWARRIVRESRPIFDAVDADFVIAGGWCRDTARGDPTRDADLWFPTQEARDRVAATIKEVGVVEKKGSSGLAEEASVPGLPTALDLIYDKDRPCGASLIETFDLTCCQCVVLRRGDVWATPEFVEDAIENKRLRVAAPRVAADNLRHAMRLAAKGYTFKSAKEADDAVRAWYGTLAKKEAV